MTMTPPSPDVSSGDSLQEFSSVARFVREVMPTVPGGRRRIDTIHGHIALIHQAATDRGLRLRKIGGSVYFYDGAHPVGGMTKWTPSLVSPQAVQVCASKDLTKQMLAAARLPTPGGIALGSHQFDDAVDHLRTTSRPMILKPTDAQGAAGFTAAILDEDDLRAAWASAVDASLGNPTLLLEDQVDGFDIRAFVVGGRVAAATTRVNAHVVGDGRLSISALITEKQAWRDQHAVLRKRPLTVEPAVLARAGRSIDDVPEAGEVVVLNSSSNLHTGGENVDVTDLAHPGLLDLAIAVTRAIPGLGIAGVDLMARDIDSPDGAVVLEANVTANIRVHHYPAYGQSRDVAGAIIDAMIASTDAPTRAPSTNVTTTGPTRRPARAGLRRRPRESP